ncbi:TonB-dependent receptor [Roseateles sp. BYS180W]|uniref:TonB-dependent receptor n=1 Tax=Roseateles rivi TaxID=3299028 RepID=A0ABW7FTS3_9BURK
MFRTTVVGRAVCLMLGTAYALSGHAQENKLERVEITGSSIKRIASEGALPVQVVSAEQIRASGATSVAEVVQKLPSMQGFQVADTAIGTNSGGIATVSLHDIGASYTLVLLNGRRIAPTGSGSTINLNAIPMSAIERVEVLTDGASALYGSDAIAGVVNFVLKRNHTGGNITAQMDAPQQGGGKSGNLSLTYGLGNIETDRFSLVATYRHDDQRPMKSGERDFAKTSYLRFQNDGRDYIYDRTSTSAVPANATVTFKKGSNIPSYSFNPYQKVNGECAPNNYYSLNNATTANAITQSCAFDFVSTIDIYPESKRDSLYLSGQLQATSNLKLFSDVAYSRLDLIARIAPNPVPVAIPSSGVYFDKYIKPNLTANQLANINTISASYRGVDFGTRDSETITDSKHVVLGGELDIGNWNVNSAFTWSQNAINEQYVGGYFKTKEFTDLVKAVAFDPFDLPGKQSEATQKAMADSIYHGSIRTAKTTLKGVDARASGDLFKLPAGTVSMGVGADYRQYNYSQDPSVDAANGIIYNLSPSPQYDMSRSNAGVFTELVAPLFKGIEVTGSLRYDTVSAIKDATTNSTIGKSMSASTYKLAGRYQVSNQLLLRTSYGTGFKAPSMLDIAQPLVSAGVTAASYDCPYPGTDFCKPGKLQYSVLSGGNAALKPEKSTQWTYGFRFEPSNNFGFGADYWRVNIKDAVSGVSEKQAFSDPTKYANLFTKFKTPAETQEYYAFISSSLNIGRTVNSGVDWDVIARFAASDAKITVGLTGTHLLKSSYTRPGTDNDWTDSMNKYGENNAVSFRNILRGTFKYESGAWTHALTLKWRNGYKDISQNVRDVATKSTVKVQLDVPDYSTMDWQTGYKFNKSLDLRVGINNLLNVAPPLTLRDSSGHQVGYDPRYADPKGRTFYLNASYSF